MGGVVFLGAVLSVGPGAQFKFMHAPGLLVSGLR